MIDASALYEVGNAQCDGGPVEFRRIAIHVVGASAEGNTRGSRAIRGAAAVRLSLRSDREHATGHALPRGAGADDTSWNAAQHCDYSATVLPLDEIQALVLLSPREDHRAKVMFLPRGLS